MNHRCFRSVLLNSKSKGSARLVLLVLAMQSEEDFRAFPCIDRLAELARMAPRSVRSALNRLLAIGELEKCGKHGDDGVRVAGYLVRVPPVETDAPLDPVPVP